MKFRIGTFIMAGLLVGVSALTLSSAASAHVTVRPTEVVTAGFQTFTVSVPNEKDIPTTAVRVVMPEGLTYVTPTQKAGWRIDVEKIGESERAVVKSITWSGSAIEQGLRDEFTFAAKVPNTAVELRWNAYQTYSDGTVVAWDRETEGGHGTEENAGPFSVTKVVAESPEDVAIDKAQQAAAEAKNTANIALYVGGAGLLLGLVSIFLATRKK